MDNKRTTYQDRNGGFYRSYPCRYCTQEIRFAKTTGGNTVAVNAGITICQHTHAMEREFSLADIEAGIVKKIRNFKTGLHIGDKGYRIHSEVCPAQQKSRKPEATNKNQMEIF